MGGRLTITIFFYLLRFFPYAKLKEQILMNIFLGIILDS